MIDFYYHSFRVLKLVQKGRSKKAEGRRQKAEKFEIQALFMSTPN